MTYQFRKKLLQSGEKQSAELRIRPNKGSVLPVLMEGTVNADLDGDSGQFRLILMDISRRKELEAELLQARKMEAIGSLAAGIAHDFNNILTACLGYAEIVKDCGGFLKIESAPEQGTTVSIYFPVVGETEERGVEKGKVLKELPSTGSEHILLVDDEKNIARIFKQLLEQFGYKVTAHYSSIESLETFRATPDSFDLVLTDQRMPWQGGMELAARIREIRPDIPIILCTGYSSTIDAKEAERIGIKRIIMKPIGAAALAKNVREVLDQ